jgi:hypothetical protein
MAKTNGKHWIEKATAKDKGKLREETGTKPGKDISEKRLHAAARSKNDTVRKEAELAETLRKMHK